MIGLLDINVLIALAWPNHSHHKIVSDWFARNCTNGWATCPLTQFGFVRVSSNQRAIPEAKSPQEALQVLRRVTSLAGHVFWQDDVQLAATDLVAKEKLRGHRQVTDAHLVALALRHEGRLVTLDGAIHELVPQQFGREDVVCLVTEEVH